MSDTNASLAPAADDANRSLNLSGASFLLGDAALFASAISHSKLKGDRAQLGTAFTAASWGVGGLAAGVFGHPLPDRRLRIEAQKLARYLEHQGVALPEDLREENPLFADRGLIDRAIQFCFTYPSELLNGIYGVCSLGMIHSGLSAKRSGAAQSSDLLGGAAVVAGAVAGLMIKEDPDAPKKAENGSPVQKAIAWMQERPLRVSGSLYMVNDVLLARRGFREYMSEYKSSPAGKKDYRFLYTFGAVVAYGIANIYLWTSSRDTSKHGKPLTPQGKEQLQQLAAEIVAGQPKGLKEKTRQTVSDYLTNQRGIAIPPEKIREQFSDEVQAASERRIENVREHGWAVREKEQRQMETNTEAGRS